jgi:hypothetical protein
MKKDFIKINRVLTRSFLMVSMVLLLMLRGSPVLTVRAAADNADRGNVAGESTESESTESENAEIENAEIGGGELFFDAGVVRNRANSYSSLSDLHGIAVFTDSFIALEAKYQEEMTSERTGMGAMILMSAPPNKEYEEVAALVLEAEEPRIIRDDYRREMQTGDIWYWVIGIMVSFALLGIALVIEDMWKKRRKKIESYRNHPSH